MYVTSAQGQCYIPDVSYIPKHLQQLSNTVLVRGLWKMLLKRFELCYRYNNLVNKHELLRITVDVQYKSKCMSRKNITITVAHFTQNISAKNFSLYEW